MSERMLFEATWEEVLEQVRSCDAEVREVLEVVVEEHFPLLLYKARKVLGGSDEVYEAVREGVARACRNLQGWSPERLAQLQACGWLSLIVYRTALNMRRRKEREVSLQRLLEARSGSDEGTERIVWLWLHRTEDPEIEVIRQELIEAIQGAIASTPKNYRRILELYYSDAGKTQQQIAEELLIPLGTVKSAVHRSLRMMRCSLEEQGYHARDLGLWER
jgi:RNA polymerase sigma factor (sigma-70 family)